jgi:hypothetical protein
MARPADRPTDEPIDIGWDEKIKKHGYGIDPEAASKDEMEEYALTKIYLHEKEDFSDYNLWFIFKEEFENWTEDNLKALRTDTKMKLRRHLLQRGVYVAPYKARLSLARVLLDVIQEEDEPHKWTDDELQATLQEVCPMITVSLRNRLNASLTQLAANISHNLRRPVTPPVTSPGATPAPAPPSDYKQIHSLLDQMLHNKEGGDNSTNDTATAAPKYSREAATIAKIYTDDQKYAGVANSFDFKLTIFYDICKRSGVPPDGYMTVFPTMLKGLAQDYYYSSSMSTRTFEEACNHIRQFFEGPEFYRKNLNEWNATSLQSVINENPDKPIYQNFQALIDKLLKQRHGIHPEFRTNLFLTNKLVVACQGVPACRIAVSDPSEDLSTLISKLQSSIVAWEKENPYQSATNPSAYFTDRKYYQNTYNDRNDGRKNKSNYYDRGRGINRDNSRKCYICQKEDCRSWKHTDEERRRSKDEYKRRFDRSNKRRNGDFDKRYRQYITYCEGDDEDASAEAFEAAILGESGDDEDDSDC